MINGEAKMSFKLEEYPDLMKQSTSQHRQKMNKYASIKPKGYSYVAYFYSVIYNNVDQTT